MRWLGAVAVHRVGGDGLDEIAMSLALRRRRGWHVAPKDLSVRMAALLLLQQYGAHLNSCFSGGGNYLFRCDACISNLCDIQRERMPLQVGDYGSKLVVGLNGGKTLIGKVVAIRQHNVTSLLRFLFVASHHPSIHPTPDRAFVETYRKFIHQYSIQSAIPQQPVTCDTALTTLKLMMIPNLVNQQPTSKAFPKMVNREAFNIVCRATLNKHVNTHIRFIRNHTGGQS